METPRDKVLNEFRSDENLSQSERLYAGQCIEFFFGIIRIVKLLKNKGFNPKIDVKSIFDFDSILEWLKTQRADANYYKDVKVKSWFEGQEVIVRYIRIHEGEINDPERLKLLQDMIYTRFFPQDRLEE